MEKFKKILENKKIKDVQANLNMQNPFIFGSLLTIISLISALFFGILHLFLKLKYSITLILSVYFLMVISLVWIYKKKCNENLSIMLIVKAILLNSVFISIITYTVSFFLFLRNSNLIILSALFGALSFMGQLILAHIALTLSNYIPLEFINNFSISKLNMNSNEKIIFKAKRNNFSTYIIQLFSFLLFILYLYYRGINLMLRYKIIGKIELLVICLFILIYYIDNYFASCFILTTDKIIIKHLCTYKEISYDQIQSIKASQSFDFGNIYILTKNGKKFKSGIIINPNDIKKRIYKYIKNEECMQ